MADNILIYYFGDDEAYFRSLQAEFKRSNISAVFQKFYETEGSKIQSLFLNVYQQRPSCVFIDFSQHTQDYLHLARLLSRTPMDHNLKMVGLVDYLSPPEVLVESTATGVNLTFIKSAETYDVAFEIQKLLKPEQNNPHGFAVANLRDDWQAGIPCKIGYIHDTGLHLETDYKPVSGQKLTLKHYWSRKNIIPSMEMSVREVFNTNLYYHFQNAADLDFIFVDELVSTETEDPERRARLESARKDSVDLYRQRLHKWVSENAQFSFEKKEKVLAVDKNFHFFQDKLRTDKLPYTVRCIPYFKDISDELHRLRPQIIAFELEIPVEGEPEGKNNFEVLEKLVRILKAKYTDSPTYVIVFNCNLTSKVLQEQYGYSQIMAHNGELSSEVLTGMIEIFRKKIQQPSSQAVQKIFLKKTNVASMAEIIISIQVLKLSETDIVFTTDVPLIEGINLHVTSPVDMIISAHPAKADSKSPAYYGLIHGIGEDGKKELRRYINAVFFREHDAKLQLEAAEFKRLNEAKLVEKLEELKVQEEAVKAAEEQKNPEEIEDFEKPLDDKVS